MTRKQMLMALAAYFDRHEYNFPHDITLATVLLAIKDKWKLTEVGMREMYIVAAWRYDRDDLMAQYKPMISVLYQILIEHGKLENRQKDAEVRKESDGEPS